MAGTEERLYMTTDSILEDDADQVSINLFFRIIERDRRFIDTEYDVKHDIKELERQLYDDDFIARATYDQCRALMTLMLKGDHHCEEGYWVKTEKGYWEKVYQEKRIKSVLQRMIELPEVKPFTRWGP